MTGLGKWFTRWTRQWPRGSRGGSWEPAAPACVHRGKREASLLTWLTRIVLNEAYGRLRQRHPSVDIEQIEAAQLEPGNVVAFPGGAAPTEPPAAAARDQIRHVLEGAIDALPESFRIVFILREIEECSVDETAKALDLRPETVKTRLFRARRLLRSQLQDSLAATLGDAFPFLGPRCDRITGTVMARVCALDHLEACPPVT